MIQIFNGGCGTVHPSSFQMLRPQGFAHYVLVMIKSSAILQINKQKFRLTPPQAILISPGTPYQYSNPEGDFINDWIQFEPMEPDFARTLAPLCNHPCPIGNPTLFTFCIRQIIWESSYAHPDFSQPDLDALFTLMINHLSINQEKREDETGEQTLSAHLRGVRQILHDTPEQPHHAHEFAQQLNISDSYFQALYRRQFGIPFCQDLIQMRIARAKLLVGSGGLALSRVAELCGYNNEIHFYRQFKKATGLTPAAYRKQTLA